jgi:transcriptional regulator with XRE-family HTH domain
MQRLAYTSLMRLPNLIKRTRQEKKISVREVARRIGVSAGTVSRWESGENIPSGDNLAQLGVVLGIDPRVLNAAAREEEAESDILGVDIRKVPKDRRPALKRLIDTAVQSFEED